MHSGECCDWNLRIAEAKTAASSAKSPLPEAMCLIQPSMKKALPALLLGRECSIYKPFVKPLFELLLPSERSVE
jgi:hypothetical protein